MTSTLAELTRKQLSLLDTDTTLLPTLRLTVFGKKEDLAAAVSRLSGYPKIEVSWVDALAEPEPTTSGSVPAATTEDAGPDPVDPTKPSEATEFMLDSYSSLPTSIHPELGPEQQMPGLRKQLPPDKVLEFLRMISLVYEASRTPLTVSGLHTIPAIGADRTGRRDWRDTTGETAPLLDVPQLNADTLFVPPVVHYISLGDPPTDPGTKNESGAWRSVTEAKSPWWYMSISTGRCSTRLGG